MMGWLDKLGEVVLVPLGVALFFVSVVVIAMESRPNEALRGDGGLLRPDAAGEISLLRSPPEQADPLLRDAGGGGAVREGAARTPWTPGWLTVLVGVMCAFVLLVLLIYYDAKTR